ncbi:GspH/FimT family pseudopilin [Acinetobacter brisouii]
MRTQGFTLFELIITVLVLAILTMLAVPSMTNFIKSNKIKSSSSDITNFLQQARSEAIKTGKTTTVCASTDGATCVTSNQTAWNVGLISKSTSITSTATVINSVLAFNDQNLNITGPTQISFNSVGATDNTYQITVGMTGQDTYSVCVAVAGRAERIKGSTC